MVYFNECKTLHEVKQKYRDLVKVHHPDKGGDKATMQAINNEYEQAVKKVLAGGTFTAEEQEEEIINAEEYKQAINAIHNLPGLQIEICGAWIWVSGDTYTHRATLKANKFQFAPVKKMWYFRSPEYKTHNKGSTSMEDIRKKYGSQSVKTNPSKQIR